MRKLLLMLSIAGTVASCDVCVAVGGSTFGTNTAELAGIQFVDTDDALHAFEAQHADIWRLGGVDFNAGRLGGQV